MTDDTENLIENVIEVDIEEVLRLTQEAADCAEESDIRQLIQEGRNSDAEDWIVTRLNAEYRYENVARRAARRALSERSGLPVRGRIATLLVTPLEPLPPMRAHQVRQRVETAFKELELPLPAVLYGWSK